LMLAVALGVPAVAQQSPDQVQTGASSASPQTNSSENPADNSTYATGQPLPTKSNEGFWGHMNPFARKKWVNRQLDPVKGRLNELDQLSAKNAQDIKDVDSRAQAGIRSAQSTADQANQVATDAGNRASQAQTLAQQASTQTDKLNTTVANLDQYQAVTDTEIRFRSGQTILNTKAKEALDSLATQLDGKQGYVVEVQGYSRTAGQAGIQTSQRMADAVVRYLVTEHHVPIYRIHQLAMGNAKLDGAEKVTGPTVHVTLMQNSLAALNQPVS
jgi:outer membrane protein OmpA-like peptidoglycan-associated protein